MADDNLPDDQQEVVFHYIKSNHFRVVHVDGAWGGLTPQRNFTISFFNERVAIPQQVVHKVNADGTLGDEIQGKRLTRKGVVREVEVDLVFDVEVAVRLHKWLGERIPILQGMIKKTSEQQK